MSFQDMFLVSTSLETVSFFNIYWKTKFASKKKS